MDIVEAILVQHVHHFSGEVGSSHFMVVSLGMVPEFPERAIPMVTRREHDGKFRDTVFPPFLLSGDRQKIKDALCKRVDKIFDAQEMLWTEPNGRGNEQ